MSVKLRTQVTVKTPALEIAHQDLKGHAGPGVAQVAVVINRHPAGVKTHFSRGEGLEGFFMSA